MSYARLRSSRCTTVVQGRPPVTRIGPRLAQNRILYPDAPLAFCPVLRYQTSMAKESIEDLARRLADTVPDSLRAVGDDLEKNFRGVLRSGLARLDLVTREEFEVQEAVLARTREKLERLEARLAELEADAP